MKLKLIILFCLISKVIFAASLTLTANHSLNGSLGSIEVDIDQGYAYPPFNIILEEPTGSIQQISTSDLHSKFSNLGVGLYTITVTNNIGCAAKESIEINSCSNYGGGGIHNFVLCEIKQTGDGGSGFYLVSPTLITKNSEIDNIEFRLLSDAPIISAIKDISLSKGIQIIYDIQINGKTDYDIPNQTDILDENFNLIIKLNENGEVLWVFHNEFGSESSGQRDSPKKQDYYNVNNPTTISCKVIPNPFINSIEVNILTKSSDEDLTLLLYNLNGQLIETKHIKTEKNVPSIQTLTPEVSSGTYILKITSLNGENLLVKVIKI
jgi:Secretion system C-terminal sorting domain